MANHYVIAGGSQGIGLALVKLLLEQNHRVTVLSRKEPPLSSPGLSHYIVDFSDHTPSIPPFTEPIDGAVYCPGSITLKPFTALKPEHFLADFNINVMGSIHFLKAVHSALKKSENPSAVLFSTVAVRTGMPFHASVAVAKGGVEGLVRSLAAEWAPQIRVNGIAPSLTDTPLADALLNNETKRKNAEERHPLKKINSAEQIAALTQFLLSPNAATITGQIIGVDGGLSALR